MWIALVRFSHTDAHALSCHFEITRVSAAFRCILTQYYRENLYYSIISRFEPLITEGNLTSPLNLTKHACLVPYDVLPGTTLTLFLYYQCHSTTEAEVFSFPTFRGTEYRS